MTDVQFAVTADFDRRLFWEGGQSVRYLVTRLTARRMEDRRPAKRAPLNIALVIDASGSMGAGKLEAAKKAALGLAGRLSDQDRLTVVSFASDVQVHLDAVPVTKENSAKIQTEVSRLQTRGTTCLSGGWFAGVECVSCAAEKDARMTPRVIILSDGHANEGIVDPLELGEHAGELRMRGVLTSTLGIGDGYDEQLLRGIAENGGGRLHDAELATEISSVLLGEIDDIFDTVVEDVEIELHAPGAVGVEYVGTARNDLAGGCTRVTLGPVQNDLQRAAVFKITCPKTRRNNVLEFKIKASGRLVEDRSTAKAEVINANLVAVEGMTNRAQFCDKELAEIVAQTWSAIVVSTAAGMNRDGPYQAVKNYVERELRYFSRYVKNLERGREFIQELELLAQRVGNELSSRMRKEMVIQSSLVMESRKDRRGKEKARWSTRMERGE